MEPDLVENPVGVESKPHTVDGETAGVSTQNQPILQDQETTGVDGGNNQEGQQEPHEPNESDSSSSLSLQEDLDHHNDQHESTDVSVTKDEETAVHGS